MKSSVFVSTLLASALFLSSGLATAKSSIYIDFDENDCADGALTMDFIVDTGDESFTFSPYCDYAFRDSFRMADGVRCSVQSGMCSERTLKRRFEVICWNGLQASVIFNCL